MSALTKLLVTTLLQSPVRLSMLHENSASEQLILFRHNLAVGISIYLHRDQLHGPSADFLWPQTTELACAAQPVQPS